MDRLGSEFEAFQERPELDVESEEFAQPPTSSSSWTLPPRPAGFPVLPIDEHRDEIVQRVQSQRVTFIQGDTGCGKSSMVPQYLLQESPNSRIMVSQPRRLAAISLADRVGKQLGSEDLVGYRLGQGERRESPNTRITFCTTGYLLQFLSHNPNALRGFQYIVLDEVHERSMDSDLLLLLLKLLMRLHTHLKLIVMSATLQPQLFSSYFTQFRAEQESLQVGGLRYPISTYFLDDLEHLVPQVARLSAYRDMVFNETAEVSSLSQAVQTVLLELIVTLAKPGECILVFLPGIGEIEAIQEELLLRRAPGVLLQVLPLHSLIPMDEQDKVMRPALPRHCKVVLSTNLAESSITIPDAHCVIDTGLRRGIFLDDRTGKPALLSRWVSQASARQRGGRTGRVAPGKVIHLFTRKFHDEVLAPYDEAEMVHASLERTVITTKLLLYRFGSVRDLLAMAITPPSPSRIQSSLEELYKYGAFTTSNEAAEVTVIGRLAAQLPLELPLVRLVFFGHLAGCLPECIVISAALSQQDLFTMPSKMFIPDPKRFSHSLATNFLDRIKMDDGRYSEALGSLSLYADWLERRRWASSISVNRAQAVDLAVADMCRTICARNVLPLPEEGVEELRLLADLSKNRACPEGAAKELLCRQNVDLLYFVIGAAAAPNYLQGRVVDDLQVWELTEMHGLDESRTMLLKSVPTVARSPETMKELLEYPMLKVDRVVLSGVQDVLVELAADAEETQVQQWTAVRDLSFGCKLLHQLYAQGRQKFPVLKPSGSTGNMTELPIGSLAAPRQLAWVVVGTDEITARVNPRSPLAVMADLDYGSPDWNPHVAVAFSVLGTQFPKEIYAGGVTVLPSGAFGGVMQLLMARQVLKVRAAEVEVEGETGEVTFGPDGQAVYHRRHSYVISEAQVEHNGRNVVLSFRPNLLSPAQWDRVNAIRGLINGVVRQGKMPTGPTLQTMADQLLQDLQAGVEEPATPFNWYAVEQSIGPDYLPLLSLGRETEEVEMEKRQQFQQSKEQRKQQKVDETYERFREIVKRIMKDHPDGINADKFATLPAMAKRVLKEQRVALGYPTIKDLLLSMPDLVFICIPPPGHPLRPQEKLLRLAYGIFPAGYQFAPLQQAPPPGVPVVTKLVNVTEQEEGPQTQKQLTGFEIMNSFRSMVIPEHNPDQLMLPESAGAALAPALGTGLPPGAILSDNGPHPLPTTALLTEKLKLLMAKAPPSEDALPIGKKIKPASYWRPMPRRPLEPLLREFRDVIKRALVSFPDGCPFVEFVQRVDKLMPRTLAPGTMNRRRLLKPQLKKVSIGQLIKDQTDLVVFVEAKCPGGYIVKPAPPEQEPQPRVGERICKHGQVRSLLRRVRVMRCAGRAGHSSLAKRVARRRARIRAHVRPTLKVRMVRSRVRAKTITHVRHNVYPPRKKVAVYIPKKAKNSPQPGQVPDIDYLDGEVYIPVDKLDLTTPRYDRQGKLLAPAGAFQFFEEGVARPVRSLRPEYIKARSVVQHWINQPKFQDGGPMRKFAKFIATKVGKQVEKRMNYLGYDNYSELIRSMPDLVTSKQTPDGEEWVYPAPPGLLPPPNLLSPIPMPNQVEGTFTSREQERLRRGKFPDRDNKEVAPNSVIDMGPQVFFRTPKQNNEFQWFRRLITRTAEKYKSGVTVEKFRQAMKKTAGKSIKKRRKNIGFHSIEDLLRSVPDLVTVRNDSEIGDQCTVLPASANTYVEPGVDLFGNPSGNSTIARRGWWNTNLQEDYNLIREHVQRIVTENPNGLPFVKFLKFLKAYLIREPKKRRKRLGFPSFDELVKTMPDVAYLQEDPLVAGGMLVFPAYLAPDDPDETVARPDWLLFKDIVERALMEYPTGLNLQQFAMAAALDSAPAKQRRRDLGYRRLTDLLRSMPDVVTVHEAPDNPEAYIKWVTAASYKGPIPEFQLAPKTAPKETKADRRRRLRLPGHLRPGFAAFRQIVQKHISYFPEEGVPLKEFIQDTNLGTPKWKRRIRAYGYQRVLQLLQAMPDIITLVRTSNEKHGWRCFPADPNHLPADLMPTKSQVPLEALVQPMHATNIPLLQPSDKMMTLPPPTADMTAPSPGANAHLLMGQTKLYQPVTQNQALTTGRESSANPPQSSTNQSAMPRPPRTHNIKIKLNISSIPSTTIVVPIVQPDNPQPIADYNLLHDLRAYVLNAHNIGTLACASSSSLPLSSKSGNGPKWMKGRASSWALDSPVLVGLSPTDTPPRSTLSPEPPVVHRLPSVSALGAEGNLYNQQHPGGQQPGTRLGCTCVCHPKTGGLAVAHPKSLGRLQTFETSTGCTIS